MSWTRFKCLVGLHRWKKTPRGKGKVCLNCGRIFHGWF